MVQTIPLFEQLFESKGSKEDLAVSFLTAILGALVDIACQEAEEKSVGIVGLTGGVSYDATVCRLVKDLARSRGFDLLLPDQIPNGEGGISTGQCAIALSMLNG